MSFIRDNYNRIAHYKYIIKPKQKKMNEEEIRVWIKTLKETLTGNLFEDMETQQRIYELKIKLNPEIAQRPELDDDECLSCGS